jgi:hypothetical protein
MANISKRESQGTVYSFAVYNHLLVAGYETGDIRVWNTITWECEVGIAHTSSINLSANKKNKNKNKPLFD